MSIIRILPENLANQIAAGEVVERPASVVKELLENAIDAGATRVDIQVEGNGTRLIRVIDDGCGMDQDDVLLSLERHATSKLASIEELAAIRSLGFRGEAVPSIASVARLRITSRRAEDALGCQADVRYGKLIKVHEMGCQPGTTFEVSDLFGNVPARRKFLKSDRTEIGHIEEVVRGYGLCRPGLGLSLAVDGREVIRLPAGGDTPQSRAERLLPRSAGRLIPVGDGNANPAGVAVSGYLLPPDAPVAGGLRLFVNGRTVADRMLLHAVAEGLQGFLMKGRRPGGVIFVALEPGRVDVNVHPTKQEVRFQRSVEVRAAVVEAVRAAMARHQAGVKQELFGGMGGVPAPTPKGERYAPPQPPRLMVREPAPSFRAEPAIPAVTAPPPASAAAPPRPETVAPPVAPERQRPAPKPEAPKPVALARPASPERIEPPAAPPAMAKEAPASQASRAVAPPAPVATPEAPAAPPVWPEAAPAPPRYLGQVLETYLLCESQEGLLVIDQHAAHERLLFERLQAQFASRAIARQGLLFPKLIECGLAESRILSRHAEEIAALGLEIEEFGSGSFVVKAIPAILARSPVEEIMASIFARFGEGGQAGEARAEEVLADIACKAAVRAGQKLAPQEAEALLAEMRQAGIFSHCPHGRPVARLFAPHELKKWFYRG
ncbi:MAG: DNA mismatch repair endonuclease MutL [Thermodesulfobacteriota bacterium]